MLGSFLTIYLIGVLLLLRCFLQTLILFQKLGISFFNSYVEEEEEEEEHLLWQINNNTMLYMISFAKETPIKTCNMSLAWEPPYYNDIIILI